MFDTCAGMRRCKAHNTTVQGAVSAATMVAQAAAQAARNPLPQTIVMQCPVDVRKQVCAPGPCKASVAGSSFSILRTHAYE